MNNKLLVVALFFTLTMFSQSGTLDGSFGANGKVITSINGVEDKARSVVIQSDGKIVVAGYTFSNIFGFDFLCLRYNTDGSLDTSFGTNGIATFDLQTGSDDKAYSVDLQLDGKIVIGGYSDDGSNRNAAIIRLNTDGSLDSGFGTSGVSITNVSNEDELRVVKIHYVTGNIVGGGVSYSDTDEANAIFIRLTPNGQLDTNFSSDGKITGLPQPVSSSNGFELVIEDLAIKSNGRITAVGWIDVPGSGTAALTAEHYACRINSDGTLDDTFSDNGYDFKVLTTGNDITRSMVLNPDDSYVFSGYTTWSSVDYRTYVDYTSSNGTTTNSVENWLQLSTSTQDAGFGMERDNSGNIIIGGVSANPNTGTASFFLSSISGSDYSLTSSFGNSGYVTTDFGTVSFAYDLKVQSDDKIVMVGYSDNDVAIARYNGNTLSTDDYQKENNFSIYPNPVTNVLNFKMLNNEFSNETFRIYNVLGETVLEGKIVSNDNAVNVENLTNGFYFIGIGDNVIKFVKNN